MIYTCCDRNRRAAVDAHPTLNGIDWLEVLDLDAVAIGSPRQQTLMVRLLKPVPAGLDRENVIIEGGERVRKIGVEWVAPASAPPPEPETNAAERTFFTGLDEADHVLLVRTDSHGDRSDYTLRLVRGVDDEQAPEDFDPRLVELVFSFKVECPSDFDCKPVRVCASAPASAPDIDYLAKDYGSFRRLMLDRLSQLVPDWRERSAADLGVTLAELLAYTVDQLSYWQDAIGTEAYLGTARRRTSLRRHALLVDYAMHDGCNARVWLHVQVSGGPVAVDKEELRFYTQVPGAPDRIAPDSQDEREALQQSPLIFEPMHDALLFEAHCRSDVNGEQVDGMRFYTWGDERCCLPRGATRATLRDDAGNRLRLRPGDVLIFTERLGPRTGQTEDADPNHRQAVRLTNVHPEAQSVMNAEGVETDRVAGPLVLDPLTEGTASEQAIVEIEWAQGDALSLPLCLSAETDEAHDGALVEDVSVALGNIVLADHGQRETDELLPLVPESSLHYPPDRDASHCDQSKPEPIPPRFHPKLAEAPLTQTGRVLKTTLADGVRTTERLAFDPDAAAGEAMTWRMADVVPAIWLDPALGPATEQWEARRDLLNSESTDNHFVVETEHDGSAYLRFGDGVHGQRPDAGYELKATYRVGNGVAGNVGAEAVAHVVTDIGLVLSVVNPMAARGGVEPESAAQVRRRAPQAFRTQERAVTPEDYAEVTGRHAGVQRAAAGLRWTGSWHSVFITVDREAGEPLDGAFTESLQGHVDRYRMAGHDLRFNDPVFVSLEIDMVICVAPGHFRSYVRQALLEIFSSGVRADGRLGVFHPDSFSFGQTVYLSPLYAAARQAPGVDSVQITRFHRQGDEDSKPLTDGFMHLGRLEIPRLDNDPNYPEHGVLRLDLFGGK